MKVKQVSALRSKRGLHRVNGAEPQVVGLTPQTPDIRKTDTMKTYILRQPKPVEPQKSSRTPRPKPVPSVEQRGIHTRQPGEHLGVAPVALALVAGDGVELAGIGHDDRGPEAGEVTADPRAVRARLQRDGGAGKLREELRQGRAGVGQGRLADDVAGGIEHADVMRPITEIEAEGEPAGSSRRGVRNNGGCRTGFSGVSFHRQTLSPTHHCVSGLPSHLILLAVIVLIS